MWTDIGISPLRRYAQNNQRNRRHAAPLSDDIVKFTMKHGANLSENGMAIKTRLSSSEKKVYMG